MPSAHIFTVNSQTFNVHLNYMFAGTGKDGSAHQAGALADILGIRPEDEVLFYVAEYGFYGFFRAKQTGNHTIFYEPPESQYLNDDLGGKTLTYRLFIEPSECGVYKFGVNEWDAIENPENIEKQSIFNMQWAWIFKKLKARRGCTAIPKEEFQLLKKIIKAGNEKLKEAECYKFSDGEIATSEQLYEYQGGTGTLPALSENMKKIMREEDLRIFFSTKAGKDEIIDTILKPDKYGRIVYIANEAKCSFGMRSIDLLFLTDKGKCLLIELKNNFTRDAILVLEQLSGYAKWISSYKQDLEEIVPILVIRAPRLYPETWGKKFKYLSEKGFQDEILSPWYQNIINEIEKLKHEFLKKRIEKASELQVYQFNTENNILQSFSCL